jgi:hypothetical protein
LKRRLVDADFSFRNLITRLRERDFTTAPESLVHGIFQGDGL